jgi:hypothetical protein
MEPNLPERHLVFRAAVRDATTSAASGLAANAYQRAAIAKDARCYWRRTEGPGAVRIF